MTTSSGLKTFTRLGDADAEVEADVREDVAGIAGPARGELDGEARVDVSALGGRAARDRPPGSLRRGLARLAVRGGPGGQRLEVAAPGAASLAGRAVQIDRDVAELGRRADGAAVELAVEDEAAADPGAEGEHDHVP